MSYSCLACASVSGSGAAAEVDAADRAASLNAMHVVGPATYRHLGKMLSPALYRDDSSSPLNSGRTCSHGWRVHGGLRFAWVCMGDHDSVRIAQSNKLTSSFNLYRSGIHCRFALRW